MTQPNFETIAGVQAMMDTTPLHRLLGFRVLSMDSASGHFSMAASTGGNSERSDGAGQAHGGAIATLIDSTATYACCVMLGRAVPTVNLRVDYLRPAAGQQMVATAIIRKAGRTVSVVDVEVMAGGKLVAIGRADLATIS
jgi:uncharacterized protein (TIGR00369 family)